MIVSFSIFGVNVNFRIAFIRGSIYLDDHIGKVRTAAEITVTREDHL